MEGWIRLWRKVLENGWLKNHKLMILWLYCLLKASHEECKVTVGYQEVLIKPGEFVFGRRRASEETGLSEREIRTALGSLVTRQNLTIKTTNKFSIISIINWKRYQWSKAEYGPADRPASDQQRTTNNNGKNKDLNTFAESDEKEPIASPPKESLQSESRKSKTPLSDEKYFELCKIEIATLIDKNREMWEKAYPGISLDQEGAKALMWLITNPNQRKKLLGRFLNYWLSRAQEGCRVSGRGQDSPKPSSSKKLFIPCPKCGKETTRADVQAFGNCSSCIKPVCPEEFKRGIDQIFNL